MQRVRIGLTGLAGVFLLVFVAAAFFGLARHEPAPASADAAIHANAQDVTRNEEAPKEPLAELGLTPGNLPDKEAPAAATPPTSAPAPVPGQR